MGDGGLLKSLFMDANNAWDNHFQQQQVLDCVSERALSHIIMNHVNLIKLILRHSIAVNYCVATNQLSAVSSACGRPIVCPCSIKNWINDSPIEFSWQCSKPLCSEIWFVVVIQRIIKIKLTFRHIVSEPQITHEMERGMRKSAAQCVSTSKRLTETMLRQFSER